MDWFLKLITNPFLLISLSSWFIAQVLKTILYARINKRFDWHRLFGDGGMPSGHSATVSSLATVCALAYGPDSAIFAIAAILATIVCHDAMGVRREAGKQAFVLNEIVKAFEELSQETLPEVKLKEFVGHTPIQVAAGILIGIANAVLMWFLVV